MKFFDRKEQLSLLREIRERSYSSHSMMTVVSGRRRIGKTTLVDRAIGDEAYLYFFVGRKNETVLCNEFATEIRAKLGLFVPEGITSFKDIFALLMQYGENSKFTVFIDEFQNFMDVNDSVFSDAGNSTNSYLIVNQLYNKISISSLSPNCPHNF